MDTERSPGQRVGACELVRRIGAGGMGEVWEAVLHGPAGFRKEVAVKLLHARPSEQDRALLVREARLGARLQHPNVVSVLGLGEADGAWHVVMELVRGPSVAQLLRAGPIAPTLVLDIGAQAAAGLAHVHGLVVDGRPAGLVHCDVKPENLLVDEHGVVKVADLGIAALAGERRGAAGTLGYMAPEQVDGQPEPRSDLFALGVTLYLLAARERPFDRTVVALAGLERRLADPAFTAPVDARVPGLGEVVRRCLRARPADRWGSARELARALAQLRARLPAVPEGEPTALLRPPPDGLAATTVPDTAGPSPTPASVGNVPEPRDRFVGRAAELEAVCALLRGGERLVSLLATGGTGKTRLATEVALALGRELPGGAWMFELADARTTDEVCAAIAGQLGVPLDRTDPAAQLGRVLAAKGEALVVLDNLEQCVEAMRALVPRWLALAGRVRLLCTSRIPLKLKGERAVQLGALSLDDACALFRERAPVPIPAAHEDELRALCQELAALPLAVELAAARLRSMSVVQVRQRLGLRLLAGGAAELPDRHRSLEASIRWSWDLLPPHARTALAELSVFVGGFSLAAAEAVLDEAALGPGGWAIDVVQELAEASLLRVEPESDRVLLLPVVQAFAAARLSPAERDAVEARHAAFFAQLGAPGAIERLDVPAVLPDLENLVAAARSAIRRREVALVTPLLLACVLVLDRTGPHDLAPELLRDALALPELPDRERAQLALSAARGALVMGRTADGDRYLALAAEAAGRAGDPLLRGLLRANEALRDRLRGRIREAERAYEEALATLEPVADASVLARAISSRAGLFHEQGRDEEARAWYERSLALRRAAGDRHGEAMDRANLGNVAIALGRLPEALAHQQAALEMYREVGDRRGVAQTTGDLGLTLQALGRIDEAERHLRSALAQHRRAGNRRFEGIVCSNLGLLCLEAGRLAEAEGHLDQALEVHRATGNRRSEGIATELLARAREQAGRFAEAEALARQAAALHAEVGNRRWQGTALETLARALAAQGRADEAARVAAEAAALGQR